jgi:hypothetical protein
MIYNGVSYCEETTCLNIDCSRLADAVVRSNAKNAGQILQLETLKGTDVCAGYLDKAALIEQVMAGVPASYREPLNE